MKNFPKHYIVAIVLFVLAAIVGGGLWFWTGGQLADSLDRKNQLDTQIQAVSSRGIFPSQSNLEQIESQIAAIHEKIDPVKESLADTAKLFEPIQGKANAEGVYSGISSNDWKKLLGEKRDELIQEAANRQVQLPEGFYLGFSRYRALNPPESATYALGVQLKCLYQLANILVQSGVISIDDINRVIVEDGNTPAGTEGLQAQVVSGPMDLYSVYPFELSFTGSPRSMIQTINQIAKSPYFFVIRFVDVENQKTSVPRRNEILSQSGALDIQQLMVPIVGQEAIRVTLRVDLVLWALEEKGKEPKEAVQGGKT